MTNRAPSSDPGTETYRRTTGAKSPRQALLEAIPVTERRLRLAGISTAVLEGGDGPPLVFLHGPGGYAAHWMRLIPRLLRS